MKREQALAAAYSLLECLSDEQIIEWLVAKTKEDLAFKRLCYEKAKAPA